MGQDATALTSMRVARILLGTADRGLVVRTATWVAAVICRLGTYQHNPRPGFGRKGFFHVNLLVEFRIAVRPAFRRVAVWMALVACVTRGDESHTRATGRNEHSLFHVVNSLAVGTPKPYPTYPLS